jgi:hypothetical protein
MTDFRYADERWADVLATCPIETPASMRATLETAATRYLRERETTELMRNAASRRDELSDISVRAAELAKRVHRAGPLLSPLWGEETSDQEAIAGLERIASRAALGASEFDAYARDYAGRRNRERDVLYREVLAVWTDDLWQGLSCSPTGPLVRFFRAALLPVLGEETPKGASIRDIVKNERARRTGAPVKGRSKKNSQSKKLFAKPAASAAPLPNTRESAPR